MFSGLVKKKKVICSVSPVSCLICIHANHTNTHVPHFAITRPEENRDSCISYISGTITTPVIRPSWTSGMQFCLRFTMPNYTRLKKQVTHCSVPGTQSYRAGLYKQVFHCCLYLRILIMCVFRNHRCLVIEKYCLFTFLSLCKTRLDMNCTLCILMFWFLLHIFYFGDAWCWTEARCAF